MSKTTRKYAGEVSRISHKPGMISLVLLFLICPIPSIGTGSSQAAVFDTSQDTWAILGGYGQSIPGWGLTTERVETIDIVPRYNHVIFKDLGSGWFRGYHSVLLETPLSYVTSPDSSAMIAINFLAAYTFTADPHYQPYLFGGGGPVYSFADIPGMGAELNGNYQFGIGIKHDRDTDHDLLFELRYHHISNGGSEEPNKPLNSLKFLIGITF